MEEIHEDVLVGRTQLLQLMLKGDWTALEKILKGIEKVKAEVSYVDEDFGLSLLMVAVQKDRLSVVKRLLELEVSPEEKTKDGQTALHIAAAYASDDIVNLLSQKINPTSPGVLQISDGVMRYQISAVLWNPDISRHGHPIHPKAWLPLHYAASRSRDSIDVVRTLLKLSNKETRLIPDKPKAWLPLHYAASRSRDSIDVVRTLLKLSNKETRLIPDKEGCIPLLLAIKAKNVGIVRELLSDLTEPQLQAKIKENGDMALHICCRMKDVEMAKVLVEFNANLDSQNDDGQTPLHIATLEGDQAMVKYFYYRIANPNITDKLDRNPLHIAAERGLTKLVEIYTENFKSNVLERTKDGSTLLHIAARCGHPDTALTLLNKGIPLHIQNKVGAVCLHEAAKYGHVAVVWALLLKGMHVDTTTKDGLTALHIAAENCHPHVVEILQGFGAQVQLRGGKALESPLHIAARVKDGEKVAEMLLKSGAEVNTELENGETAMHVAARYGNLQVMKSLVEEGADLTWKSKAEETPLHVAVRHCHAHMVEAILNFLTTEKSREEAELCVRQRNQKDETTLHLAAEIQRDIVHRDDEDVLIIRTLMEYHANATAATKQTEETPIHYCARVGNTAVLQEMLHNVPSHCLQLAINMLDKTGRSALLLAAEQGHTTVVELLLQNHARVDVFDKEGKSPLHLAAEQGHKDIADFLLSKKAVVNAKTKLGLTPLHLSAQTGSSPLVKLLTESNTDQAHHLIHALTLSKQTPLHLAAISGRLDVCKCLLNLEAKVTDKDIHGKTPLDLAVENDHSDVVKLFLKHSSEISTLATCINIAAAKGNVVIIRELLMFHKSGLDILHNKVDCRGSGPLHLAAAGGHTEVVKLLLDAGASATEEDSEGMTALHLAAQNGHIHILEVLKSKVSLQTRRTALHVAACFGQVDFVREILTQEPDTINSETSRRDTLRTSADVSDIPVTTAADEEEDFCFTPLHLAAQSGQTDVVRLLLSRSSSLLHQQDHLDRTCLHLASAQGHVETVRVLLCHGAEVNHTDKFGYTPLHFAAQRGHENVVRLLLSSTGVLDEAKTNPECFTPLHLAAQSGQTDVVRLLLSRSRSLLHQQDHLDRTCLHLASAQGHVETVRVLLCHSAEVNHTDKFGYTPLHFAAQRGHENEGHVATVRVLLCHGAEVNHTDKSKRTALHYAAEAGCLELVRLLVERDASVDAECHNHLTPLQYAAKENHLTTVSFLLRQKKNNIVKLLMDKKFVIDLMLCGRLNSNLSLDEMVLYSEAPLSTAVRLSHALSSVSFDDMVYFKDLRAAASHCETLASDLLNLASTAPLGKDFGVVLRAVDQESNILDYLIKAKQKNVMSNLGVQKYLTDVLYGKPKCEFLNFRKILLLFFCMLIFPFLWMALSLPLKHRCNDIPIVKLASHLVSHIFLLMLFICTIVHPFGIPTLESQLIPGWSECLLLIWLCGMLLSEYEQKAKHVGWAWIRMFILFFSVVALLCHILAVAFQSNPKYLIDFLFARNVLLTVAMKLAFIQLLEFLMIHHLFGPWAIIIKNMMRDLCRFVIILLLFHTAFSLSFTAICHPLEPKTSFQSNYSMNTTYRNVIASEMNALDVTVLLFFALFGLTERKDMPCSEFSPAKTSGLTELAFGIYLVVTVVVLLNLLIAMLSNTYQCIQDQSDTEWKFGRAILIRDMNCKSETPSPFNLLTFIYFNAKSAYKRVGKLCLGNRQNIIRDEEAGEGSTETHFLDTMAQTSIPGILENQTSSQGEPVQIKDVVVWKSVVQRFQALRGQKDKVAPETDNMLH
ncbi:hypothetical protein HF521_011688 [Silurus meridionalis]|uniref:Ion transport domain-containing protein n=1 Tax=Silurus meridionalis TaxID=175797 RepID=A0A8T0AGE2_SILME|nr:hypothetical protein HF521_011688 [Silurus meridionalis]